MLNELAQYAYDHELAAKPGYKLKDNVKAYIVLSADGEFLGIEVRSKDAEPVYAPDIGSKAQGDRYCNPLIEKAKIILCIVEDEKKDKNVPAKHNFFLEMLIDGGSYEPSFLVIKEALMSESTRQEIIKSLANNKIKSGNIIGFKVDGIPAEKGRRVNAWWSEYRKMFAVQQGGPRRRCLVTGELTYPVPTVPKVPGLGNVGGHKSGDSISSAYAPAYQSYGGEQGGNAVLSEEGITAVNAALTDLIKKAPVLGGAKIVHWYTGGVPDDVDPISDLMDGDWGDDDENPNTENLDFEEDVDDVDFEAEERAAEKKSNKLLKSIEGGERPLELKGRYYIMPLSGASGRMMPRGWDEGNFADLYKNIDMWFDDLRLIRPSGKGFTKPPKIKALYIRLLAPGGDPKKIFERMNKELSTLSSRILDAIIKGHPLPDEVGARALRYIRSAVVSTQKDQNGEKEESKIQKETMAFQLLKAWLVRDQRQKGGEDIMGYDVDQSSHTTAYCCGQLLAVYSKIQTKAMPNVNVGVAERYYAAASTTPALVIGKLAQLSQHHLSGLKVKDAKDYEKMLDEIYVQIGRTIPTSLNQKQQAEFALGYYQQRAEMNKTENN